jgi:excisionase family DNA binding protein
MTDQLMTVEQVADYLNVPAKTLYRWRTRHKGPPGARVGRYVRYRKADVEAWVNRQASRQAEKEQRAMTVADLLEVLADLPPDTPIRVQLGPFLGTFGWHLDGAHGAMAGPDPHLVLELGAVQLADQDGGG